MTAVFHLFTTLFKSRNGENVNVNLNVRLVDRSLQGIFRINRLNGIGPNACEGAARLPPYDPCGSEHRKPSQMLLGVDFEEGGKPEYPEKNLRSQVEID